jgi:hypothetical protein
VAPLRGNRPGEVRQIVRFSRGLDLADDAVVGSVALQPERDDENVALSHILASTTLAVVLVAAPRVFRQRWEALPDAERQRALAELIGTLLLFATAGEELRAIETSPPIDAPRASVTATALARELALSRPSEAPNAPAVTLARELALALGVPTPGCGWDVYEEREADG